MDALGRGAEVDSWRIAEGLAHGRGRASCGRRKGARGCGMSLGPGAGAGVRQRQRSNVGDGRIVWNGNVEIVGVWSKANCGELEELPKRARWAWRSPPPPRPPAPRVCLQATPCCSPMDRPPHHCIRHRHHHSTAHQSIVSTSASLYTRPPAPIEPRGA